MSYCRFSDGDVYMYPSLSIGKIVCIACRLNDKDKGNWYPDTILNNEEEALNHLKEHIYAGHKVPKYATDMLKEKNKTVDEIIQVQMHLRGSEDEIEGIKKHIAESTLFKEIISLNIKKLQTKGRKKEEGKENV